MSIKVVEAELRLFSGEEEGEVVAIGMEPRLGTVVDTDQVA